MSYQHTLVIADVFSSIELKATVFWELLVWMDKANYGGTKELEPEAPRKRGPIIGPCV